MFLIEFDAVVQLEVNIPKRIGSGECWYRIKPIELTTRGRGSDVSEFHIDLQFHLLEILCVEPSMFAEHMLPRRNVPSEQERGVPTRFMQLGPIHLYHDGIYLENAPPTPLGVNQHLPFFFFLIDATVSVNIVLCGRHHCWANIPDVRHPVTVIVVQTTVSVRVPLWMCRLSRTHILGVWNAIAIVVVQATIAVCIVPIIDCGFVWTCVIFVANSIPVIVEVLSGISVNTFHQKRKPD